MQQSELAVLMSSGSIFQHHTVNSGPIGLHACAVLETIVNWNVGSSFAAVAKDLRGMQQLSQRTTVLVLTLFCNRPLQLTRLNELVKKMSQVTLPDTSHFIVHKSTPSTLIFLHTALYLALRQ